MQVSPKTWVWPGFAAGMGGKWGVGCTSKGVDMCAWVSLCLSLVGGYV